jgi:hypothetical protein
MEVPDTRRNRERRLAKHRHDPDVFRPVLEDDYAAGQRRWQRVDNDPGGRLRFSERYDAWRSRSARRRIVD